MTSAQASPQTGSVVAPGTPLALPEGMRHYIVRPDNTMVPLIPADQLPFQVVGVPRQITHEQMSKEGWKYLITPTLPKSHLPVQAPASCEPVKANPPQLPPRSLAPDHEVRAIFSKESPLLTDTVISTLTMAEIASKPSSSPTREELGLPPFQKPRTSFKPSAILSRDKVEQPGVAYLKAVQPSLAESITTSYPKDAQRVSYPFRKPNPSGIEQDPPKKVYCTHWIKTGECNWAAIGCRFKHEIPNKLDDLRALGFREWPKWWKEEQAKITRGPTWMQRAVNQKEEQPKFKPKPVPAHANKAHALFNRISKESNEEMLNYSSAEQPRGVVSFDHSDEDLVGLHSVTPAPSRRGSVSSASSCSSKEYDAASSVSSAESVRSTHRSNAVADSGKKPITEGATPVSAPAPTVKGKQTVRLPAPSLRNVKPTDIQISHQPSTPKDASTTASSKALQTKEPRAVCGAGMSMSRFAEKATPDSAAVKVKEKTARKAKPQKRYSAKPGRDHARRERKQSSRAPERGVLLESLI